MQKGERDSERYRAEDVEMIGVYIYYIAVDCIDGDVSCMWWDVAVVLQVAAATAVATSYAEVQVVVLRVWLCVLFFIYSL